MPALLPPPPLSALPSADSVSGSGRERPPKMGRTEGKRSAAEAASSTQPPSQHDQEMVPVEGL